MSDQKFDEFIKQKLNNHASPVADDMWARIQSAREKERGTGFWGKNLRTVGIGLLAVLFSGALYYAISTNTSVDKKDVTSSNQMPISGQGVSKETSDDQLTESAEKQLSSDKEAASLAENNNAKNKIDKRKITDDHSNSTAEISITPQVKIATKRKTSLAKNNNTRNRQKNSAAFTKNLKGESINNRLDDNVDLLNNTISKTNVRPLLANHKSELLRKTSGKELLEKLKLLPVTDCPSALGESKNDWHVEAFVSPDYAFKSTKGLDDEFLRRKDSTENFTSAFTAGFRISKNIGEHLLLKTGLQYSQINEKFNFRSENERKEVTVVTVRTIVRGPNDTVRISDTSTVVQIGYRVKTTYNRYRSFDIPVIAGYEWGNENFRTSINTGLIFNLQSWQQGDMLDTSYNPVSFAKPGATVFKKNIGLGIYASVAFYKSIGSRTEVFAEPYFRYNISNMTNAGTYFNQRFHVGGINLGIRYKINGHRQQ